MRLSADQITQIRDKKGIDPLPDDYPPLSEIRRILGDHTFYLTADGLHIWEYADVTGAEDQLIIALEVASWANKEKSDLAVHKPHMTEIVVRLNVRQSAVEIAG